MGGLGVPHDIRHRFASYAEQGDVDIGRHLGLVIAGLIHRSPDTRRLQIVQQVPQAVSALGGTRLSLRSIPAQNADHGTHLTERVLCRNAYSLQGILGSGGVSLHQTQCCRCLDAHRRERMGRDVMDLPRDAHALSLNAPGGFGIGRAQSLFGAQTLSFLELLGLLRSGFGRLKEVFPHVKGIARQRHRHHENGILEQDEIVEGRSGSWSQEWNRQHTAKQQDARHKAFRTAAIIGHGEQRYQRPCQRERPYPQ